MHLAVIGNPVSHSLSPVIHQEFGKQFDLPIQYDKIQGNEPHLERQIASFFAENGDGLNVTVPYKQQAYTFVEIKKERSCASKTVNTLWMEHGKLCGDNTDGAGLIADLQAYISLENKRILLLGAGGAASAILPSLLRYTSLIFVANRTLEKARVLQEMYPSIDCLSWGKIEGDFDIILNATSASINDITLPLPELLFQKAELCYDLGYLIHGLTPFVLKAQEEGCFAMDGIGMLVEQAAEAFTIWTGLKPNPEPVKRFLRRYQLGFKEL